MILIHMMHHPCNFRFHPLEHGLQAYGPRGDQFNIWLQGSLFCTYVLDRQKNHEVDWDPHSMKTKIGGIESPMLGASYASKISHGNHLRGTHQEV